jgi:two-component system sensor histidine kinase LytS
MLTLFADLAKEIAVFVVLAFLIGRTNLFASFVARLHSWRERLLLAGSMGILGILGTYWGIPVQGAIANTRVIGPMLAGLYGGPVAGMIAGAIAGFHRLSLGGFTGVACAISTISEGLLGGLLHRVRGGRPLSARTAFLATAAAELLQMAIILLVARPWSTALALVQQIILPMTLANALGVALMVYIIADAESQKARLKAEQAQQALQLAGLTLPHLREGLSFDSAQATCQIIQEGAALAAVSITDRSQVLAYVGRGSDHHKAGGRPLMQATWDVLEDGQVRIAERAEEIGCAHGASCPVKAGIVVPLRDGEQVVGTLHLYQKEGGPVSPILIELGLGLGQLLSTQIETSRAQAMARLVTQAELRALHAQINPHFLFNALTTIAAFCRRDPGKARELLLLLSQYIRSSLRSADSLVTLGEELQVVAAYLTIEQARHGERVRSQIEVDLELQRIQVPVLSLQPLVENAIRHGLLARTAGGTVTITASQVGDELELTVLDDGVGIQAGAPSGNGVALKNVRERLRHLYGGLGSLAVTPRPGGGTRAVLRFPIADPTGSEVVAG